MMTIQNELTSFEVSGFYTVIPIQLEHVFTAGKELPTTSITLPGAAAMGVAAVITKNPVVSRRLFSWFRKE